MSPPAFRPLYPLEVPRLGPAPGAMPVLSLEQNLGPATANVHTLLADQGPMRDQNPRGSCETFAFLSAIEAYYRRHYGLVLNLSREYFIHRVFSTQLGGPAPHENFCTGPTNEPAPPSPYPGEWQMVLEDMTLPRETYAPYFGNENTGFVKYGLRHAQQDLDRIARECGILMASGEFAAPASPITQKMVDDFEYDPRHIPLEARLHARYGATEMQSLTSDQCHDTGLLEKILFSNRDIVVSVNLKHVDFGVQGTNQYASGEPLQVHGPDGYAVGVWPDKTVNNAELGHAMLLIGYDRPSKLFLLKNSFGASAWPYIWMSYDYIKAVCGGGLVVTAVRHPSLGPCNESAWLGRWRLAIGGQPVKDLVVRRTRPTAGTRGQRVPVGTLYHAGVGAQMIGCISDAEGSQLTLYPSLPPTDPNANTSRSIVLNMQEAGRLATGYDRTDVQRSIFFPLTSDESPVRLYRPIQSEDSSAALWVHGHVARAEHPEWLERTERRGWGVEFYATPGKNYWFHLPLLTPAIRNGKRLKLARVYVLYRLRGGTESLQARLTHMHAYDGYHKVREFEGLSFSGNHSEQIDSSNAWEITPAVTIHSGLGVSVLIEAPAGAGVSSILFATAGAEFVPENMWI